MVGLQASLRGLEMDRRRKLGIMLGVWIDCYGAIARTW